MKEYFTGNFFANTPDILPPILQFGGRPAFIMRAVLAATLSSVYGIYSGYELCENEAIPGKEEYLDSEKYEIKVRDWKAPGNIVDIITLINQIRHECPALQTYNNVLFLTTDNPNILAYAKMTEDRSDIVVCVVNLDPFHKHHSILHVPLATFGIPRTSNTRRTTCSPTSATAGSGPTAYVELKLRAPRWRTSSRSAAGRKHPAPVAQHLPAAGSPLAAGRSFTAQQCHAGAGSPPAVLQSAPASGALELHVLAGEVTEFDAHRLHLPDLVAVLADGPIGREETRTRHVENRHPRPAIAVEIGCRHPGLTIDVRLKSASSMYSS
jgi:hypothetical protein